MPNCIEYWAQIYEKVNGVENSEGETMSHKDPWFMAQDFQKGNKQIEPVCNS